MRYANCMHRTSRGLIAMAVLIVAACSGDTAGPRPVSDLVHRFWNVTLNTNAITLSTVAPYDTFRVVATPRDAFGDPVAAPLRDSAVTVIVPAVTGDDHVTVDSTGLIQARQPGTGIVLYVRTTLGGVTRSDSVFVNVTSVANPPQFASMRVAFTPSDTLYTADFFRSPPTLVGQALDNNGNVIDSVAFAFRSADSTLIRIDPTGQLNFAISRPGFGRVMIYASATVYGVTRTDSVPLNITAPYFATVFINTSVPRGHTAPVAYFAPVVDTVAVGAVVMWSFGGIGEPTPTDVTFDDPTHVTAIPPEAPLYAFFGTCDTNRDGNIPAIILDPNVLCTNVWPRYFPVAGTYPYRSALNGTSGTIVVVP